MTMIEINNLTKIYGKGEKAVHALRGLSLTVAHGEIFGVIGLSGAGKSTLIRCLNRLERPTSGTVKVAGRDITRLPEYQLRAARREIGMIFQHFNLLSSRTVFGNIAFPLEVAGRKAAEIKPRVEELLCLVGLEDKANMYPSQLSGGQKQRVGIARSLANRPKVLLCDEATSALDPQTTQSILKLILDIKEKLGLTVVLITHEMTVITEICDRVAVMEDGYIVEMGPVIEVFTKPQHPTSKEFVNVVINQSLPEAFSDYKPKGALVRLFFIGPSAEQPFISRMIKQFNVEVNILHGQIDHLKDVPFGMLLMDISGSAPDRREALAYLRRQNVHLEVLANDA